MRVSALLLSLLLASCSSGGGDTPSPAPTPTPTPTPSTAPTWQQASVVIERVCAPCHNGVKEPPFTSGAVFKASAAKAKLTSGAMPPSPATISASDKSLLLAYLGN